MYGLENWKTLMQNRVRRREAARQNCVRVYSSILSRLKITDSGRSESKQTIFHGLFIVSNIILAFFPFHFISFASSRNRRAGSIAFFSLLHSNYLFSTFFCDHLNENDDDALYSIIYSKRLLFVKSTLFQNALNAIGNLNLVTQPAIYLYIYIYI